jgi:hypothetical protein
MAGRHSRQPGAYLVIPVSAEFGVVCQSRLRMRQEVINGSGKRTPTA